MTNNSCRVLVAMLIISSICPTAEGGQSQPSVAIITGEIPGADLAGSYIWLRVADGSGKKVRAACCSGQPEPLRP